MPQKLASAYILKKLNILYKGLYGLGRQKRKSWRIFKFNSL